jgi:hypothetical protein
MAATIKVVGRDRFAYRCDKLLRYSNKMRLFAVSAREF